MEKGGSFVSKHNERTEICVVVYLLDGSSLRAKCNARRLGNDNSGTDINEMLFKMSVNKQSSKPKKALSMTFNSLLLDRSNTDSCGNVVNAASSKRNSRLFDRSKVASD